MLFFKTCCSPQVMFSNKNIDVAFHRNNRCKTKHHDTHYGKIISLRVVVQSINSGIVTEWTPFISPSLLEASVCSGAGTHMVATCCLRAADCFFNDLSTCNLIILLRKFFTALVCYLLIIGDEYKPACCATFGIAHSTPYHPDCMSYRLHQLI